MYWQEPQLGHDVVNLGLRPNWNNGIMEYWNAGFEGVFLQFKWVIFRFYTQYSSIPAFHSDGINRLPFKD